jgi:C4-dicarboxylate-specific signal transduction histidine kinase
MSETRKISDPIDKSNRVSGWFLACYILLTLITIGGLTTSLFFSHNLLSNIDSLIKADDALTYKLKRLFHMARLMRSSAINVLDMDLAEILESKSESMDINYQMYQEVSQQLRAALDQDGLPSDHDVRNAFAATNEAMNSLQREVKSILTNVASDRHSTQKLVKQVYETAGIAASRVQNLEEQILAYQESTHRERESKAKELRKIEVYSALIIIAVATIIASVGYLIWRKQRQQDELISMQRAVLINSSKMSALGEMAGGIAHEINNPLGTITTRARHIKMLLKKEPIDREKAVEFASIIEDTGYRIAQIVQGMRTFSRNADKDPFNVAEVNVLVQETLSLCSEKFKNHGIDLIFEVGGPSLEVSCRQSQISQVLLNLLNNAHDAILGLEKKWIRIVVEDLGERVAIGIVDSGKGVPDAVREKIFNPFFTTKDIGKGTGLGLSISKGIVDDHGGKIFVEASCPNTKFVVELPKDHPTSVTPTAA